MYAYKGKDANKPKRPMSAYFIWLGEFREKMKGKFAENKDLLRAAGEEWKKLNEEEKKPYEEKAELERKKYEEKMREYHQVKNTDDSNDDYIKIEKWKWLWSMNKFVKSRVELGTP